MARLVYLYDVLADAHQEDILQARRHHRMLRRIDNVFDLREDEFHLTYRLKHALFDSLCDDIEPILKPALRIGAICPTRKILAALNFYASGGYQRYVGSTSNMSQQSTSRAIHEVTDALNSPHILAKYIHFPQNFEERSEIKQRFFQKFKIPGVIGCIDGTHVALIRPKEYEERYFNRKYYHSLNVQMICDSALNIMSVDASFGGASHDSFIWNNHPIQNHLKELTAAGESCYLLGDSGYAQRKYMMTPILDAPPGSVDDYYNKIQKSARNTVERAFGVLKGRWRCLLAARELHYDPTMVAKIVNACCVLHNLCNQDRVQYLLQQPHREIEQEQQMQEYAEPGLPQELPGPANGRALREGREARSQLARHLWASRRL